MEYSTINYEPFDGKQEFDTTSIHVTNNQQSTQNEIVDLCSSDDEEPSSSDAVPKKSMSVFSNQKLPHVKTEHPNTEDAKSVSEINSIGSSVNTQIIPNIINSYINSSVSSSQGTKNPASLPDVCQTTKIIIDLTDDYDDSESSLNNKITVVSNAKPVPGALPLPTDSMPNFLNQYIMVLDTSLDEDLEGEIMDISPIPLLLVESRISDDPRINPRVIMKWDFDTENKVEGIESFEIHYYKLDENSSLKRDEWKLIGTVNALAMPMACTIQLGNQKKVVYFFCIRAKDIHNRYGPYSIPRSIVIY